MKLYDAWKRIAYDAKGQPVKHIWDEYMAQEKEVYKRIINARESRAEGSMAELAGKFGLSDVHMAAFIDGIHECVDGLPKLEDLEEQTTVVIDINWERLYKQMVEYKAEDLYTLAEWEGIFSKEEQKQLYTEQKKSHTIIRNEVKVGRNDQCPCGSGKKYKKCCGATA